jgi:hypothetical protein
VGRRGIAQAWPCNRSLHNTHGLHNPSHLRHHRPVSLARAVGARGLRHLSFRRAYLKQTAMCESRSIT